jgi:hypothetical protein
MAEFVRTRTRRPLVAAALLGALVLTGCTPAASAPPSSTPEPVPSDSAAPVETPTPTPTAVTSEPIDIGCDAVITLDDMYAFNPNISSVADPVPTAGSKASEIAAMDGLVCQWSNNSSNTTIDVAVAKLSEDQLTDLMNLAVTESVQVPTYGAPPVEGYFTVVENQGEAQVFSGSYWVTLRSADFFEPGDAEQLAKAAVSHLP